LTSKLTYVLQKITVLLKLICNIKFQFDDLNCCTVTLCITILFVIIMETLNLSLCLSHGREGRRGGRVRGGADRSADCRHAAAPGRLHRHPVPQQAAEAAGLAHHHPQEPLQRQGQHEGNHQTG
jgi:hypothetical protein